MRNVVLHILILVGLHTTQAQNLTSGLDNGDECPAFDPFHVSGPDRNKEVCPMCKYGQRQGVMIWVNNNDWKALDPILQRMETEIKARGLRQFRVFVMYMNPDNKLRDALIKECRENAARLKLNDVALTCVISPTDRESAALFNINPDKRVKNTVLVYNRRRVVHKTLNLTEAGLNELLKACDKQFANHPL